MDLLDVMNYELYGEERAVAGGVGLVTSCSYQIED